MKLVIKNKQGQVLTSWGEDKKSPQFGGRYPYIYDESLGDPIDSVELDLIWLKQNLHIDAYGVSLDKEAFVI